MGPPHLFDIASPLPAFAGFFMRVLLKKFLDFFVQNLYNYDSKVGERMKNVFEFPREKAIQKQLEETCDELIEIHDNLGRAYEICDVIEKKLSEVEKVYNRQLLQYVKAVGVENVPVGFLDYASEHISIDMKTGEIKYEPPEETEIVFTPWEED